MRAGVLPEAFLVRQIFDLLIVGGDDVVADGGLFWGRFSDVKFFRRGSAGVASPIDKRFGKRAGVEQQACQYEI